MHTRKFLHGSARVGRAVRAALIEGLRAAVRAIRRAMAAVFLACAHMSRHLLAKLLLPLLPLLLRVAGAPARRRRRAPSRARCADGSPPRPAGATARCARRLAVCHVDRSSGMQQRAQTAAMSSPARRGDQRRGVSSRYPMPLAARLVRKHESRETCGAASARWAPHTSTHTDTVTSTYRGNLSSRPYAMKNAHRNTTLHFIFVRVIIKTNSRSVVVRI